MRCEQDGTWAFVAAMVFFLCCSLAVLGCSNGSRIDEAVIAKRQWYVAEPPVLYAQYYVLVSDTAIVHGPLVEYHQNGKISGVRNVVLGKSEGPYWKFREDGALYESGACVDGVLCGLRCRYHVNGRVWLEMEFVNGKVWNIIKQFDPSGVELDSGDLRDGNGYAKYFREDGFPDEEGKYVGGLREGVWRLYGLQPSLVAEMVYKNGKTYSPFGDSVDAVD